MTLQPPSNLKKSKYTSALNALEIFGETFDEIVRTGLESIYSTQLRTKLTPILNGIIRDLHSLESDTFPRRLIQFIEGTALPLMSPLSEDNLASIIIMMAVEFAANLEKALLAGPWTFKIIEVISGDLRKFVHYLASITEYRAKGELAKVSLMVSFLECETKTDAIAFYESFDKKLAMLSPGEVKSLLSSRTDW